MKPILFNTEMVQAIVDGLKTVTRRPIKPQPEKSAHSQYECVGGRFAFRIGERGCTDQYKPPCRPGDILYVRETWARGSIGGGPERYYYKADYSEYYPISWRPSIHMPREAARIFLRVKNVRVERLQEITIDGIKAEGSTVRYTEPGGCRCSWREDGCMNEPCGNRDAYEWHTYADPYAELIWNKTIKPKERDLYEWNANPWVWVIEFERISKEEAILHDAKA